jgi:hypothetical protein
MLDVIIFLFLMMMMMMMIMTTTMTLLLASTDVVRAYLRGEVCVAFIIVWTARTRYGFQ